MRDHRHRSSVNYRRARHFSMIFARKCVWKINKIPEFYMTLDRKIIKIPELLLYLPEKLTKFYGILHALFARKMPEFYIAIAPIKFSGIFFGGGRAIFEFVVPLGNRMMPWQFCDDVSNGWWVIMLTDRRTDSDRQTRSQTGTTENNTSTLVARVIYVIIIASVRCSTILLI